MENLLGTTGGCLEFPTAPFLLAETFLTFVVAVPFLEFVVARVFFAVVFLDAAEFVVGAIVRRLFDGRRERARQEREFYF
jgi:hypothetical protein